MRFGKSAKEAAEEPSKGGGGGDFIKYLKEGDNTFRILQEPDEWLYYWEHFSPAGFSFPCNDTDVANPNPEGCPGCSSDNERMKRANRRIAFNVLHAFNGVEYVDAFKIGPAVADKLDNRYKRFGTITDRDYTITKYKTSGDRWDFDVEGNTPTPVDLRKSDWRDIEAMLQQSWDDAWGDPNQAAANRQATAAAPAEAPPAQLPRRATIAPQKPAPLPEEPPFEEKVYQEADLRVMPRDLLVKLIHDEMGLTAPSLLTTSDGVVDWLMELQS